MNCFRISLLLFSSVTLVTSTTFASSDLIVRPGGRLIVHANVQVNGGFVVQSGGAVDIDLGAKVTATNIVYSGTLTVLAKDIALTAGQSYQLFNAPSYTGAFLTVNLPSLTAGLSWSNALSSIGTVSVTPAAPMEIRFDSLVCTPTQMALSGSGGLPNATYLILASTNLALPAVNWTIVATNTCDANGNFSFNQPIAGDLPLRFFLIKVP